MPSEDAGLCNHIFFRWSRQTSKFSCKKASAILSRTVRIQEDQFKLNSKLVLTNYLPMKECCKHRLYLETDHYLSLGGGCRILFVSRKYLSDNPLRLCNVLMTPSPPLPPHWQLIGDQFSIVPLYTLLATTNFGNVTVKFI